MQGENYGKKHERIQEEDQCFLPKIKALNPQGEHKGKTQKLDFLLFAIINVTMTYVVSQNSYLKVKKPQKIIKSLIP